MARISQLTIAFLLPLTGCAGAGTTACAVGTGKPMPVYQLYFGRGIKTGGFVSDVHWQRFRDSVITPAMPAGYTVLDAEGAWASPGGHQTETDPTKVLIVAMPAGPDGLAAVTRVRLAYQLQFSQDMVGMIVQPACALF